jgi:uncharacterized protein
VAKLSVRVQPRSSKNKIALLEDGTLKVWVNSPPIDGQANEALCKLLSDELSVAKSSVVLVKGHSSRTKQIEFLNLSDEELKVRLNRLG